MAAMQALGNTCGLASFLAPSFGAFGALRFLCGVGIAGTKNGCFLLALSFAAFVWMGGSTAGTALVPALGDP